MLLLNMIEIREYITPQGQSVFGRWFNRLGSPASSKIVMALTRLELSNTSNVKPVGAGVSELKINYGPGYRVYFGWDGNNLVILLGAGTKKRQQKDIEDAQKLWNEYKKRKKAGEEL